MALEGVLLVFPTSFDDYAINNRIVVEFLEKMWFDIFGIIHSPQRLQKLLICFEVHHSILFHEPRIPLHHNQVCCPRDEV